MWEYAYVEMTPFPDHDQRMLDARGQEGWELVGMNRVYYWLKRPVPPAP